MPWQEWLRETSRDPIRAAAQIALAEAPTARTAAILLDQYHGALSAAIQRAAAHLAATDWPEAAATIDRFQSYRDVGLHVTTPWRVVLTGPTNVGKSSLINALAGFERAIVSHQPGTTRDIVTTVTAVDGWPVELADTAGLRDTVDELESAGIALAASRTAAADLVVVVHDATEPIDDRAAGRDPIEALRSQLRRTTRVLNVINKIDLIPAANRPGATGPGATGFASAFGRFQDRHGQTPAAPLLTSAVSGAGIAELVAHIGRSLVPSAPPAGAAVPFTPEQLAALDAARTAIDRRDAPATMAALEPLLAS